MDVLENRILENNLNIELDQAPPASRVPHQLNLYTMLTLAQKIQLWFIVRLFHGLRIINFTSIHHPVTYFPPQIQPAKV